MKKLFPIALAIVFTILAGCYHQQANRNVETDTLEKMTKESGTSTKTKKTEETFPKTPATKTESSKKSMSETSNVVKKITMESGNLLFKPNTLTLKMNQPVKITFKNTGIHTFTVDELGINLKLTGGSGSLTFIPKKTGTFQYYCAIPGHKEGGMVGTVTVTQ